MAQAFTAYSFLDIAASIVGPGGAFPLGQDAGVAEGGILWNFQAIRTRSFSARMVPRCIRYTRRRAVR